MKAELVPINGDPPIVISRDVTVVGRREYCDVVIAHETLSKRHCVLVRTDGLLMLRDLVTTNGTKVNGQRVTWAALLPNDRLTLGGYKMRIYLGPDHLPSPSEQYSRSNGRQPSQVVAPQQPQAAERAEFATPTPEPIEPGDDDAILVLDMGEEPLAMHDLVKLDDEDVIDLR